MSFKFSLAILLVLVLSCCAMLNTANEKRADDFAAVNAKTEVVETVVEDQTMEQTVVDEIDFEDSPIPIDESTIELPSDVIEVEVFPTKEEIEKMERGESLTENVLEVDSPSSSAAQI